MSPALRGRVRSCAGNWESLREGRNTGGMRFPVGGQHRSVFLVGKQPMEL